MLKADIRAILDYYLAVAVDALSTEEKPYGGKAFVQPGGEVAWDECDCEGQVWSRLVTAQPVYGPSKANGKTCVVRWDLTLAVGVLKCAAGPTSRGKMPSAAQITEGGHTFADDLLAIMTAIECDETKYRMNDAVPLGPNGGCAGSEVRFIVRMTPCCV